MNHETPQVRNVHSSARDQPSPPTVSSSRSHQGFSNEQTEEFLMKLNYLEGENKKLADLLTQERGKLKNVQ